MSTVTTPDIAEKLYYRIGEVEEITAVPAYVLRYWESEFKLLRPKKNPAGQRLYRPRDVELVQRIKTLLYDERLTLEGAKKRLLAESRKSSQQLDLGLRETQYADVLKRVRDRLTALRARLSP
jgi:DNA-binding transcriptional MerR regulator